MSFKKLSKQQLVDLALFEMKRDFIKHKDVTAIEGLLLSLGRAKLEAFLPEDLSKDEIEENLNHVDSEEFLTDY